MSPIIRQSNHTPIPNEVLDAMPQMSGPEFKVVIAVYRHFRDIHSEGGMLSGTQLCEATGLDRESMLVAVADATRHGWIATQDVDEEEDFG